MQNANIFAYMNIIKCIFEDTDTAKLSFVLCVVLVQQVGIYWVRHSECHPKHSFTYEITLQRCCKYNYLSLKYQICEHNEIF